MLRKIPSLIYDVINVNGRSLDHAIAATTGDAVITLNVDDTKKASKAVVFLDALMAGAELLQNSLFGHRGRPNDLMAFRFAGKWRLTIVCEWLSVTKFSDPFNRNFVLRRWTLPKLYPDGGRADKTVLRTQGFARPARGLQCA